MRINNNVMAFNAQRNLNISTGALGKSVEKLSSGLRINRAADDAAGLYISQRMRGEIAGLRQASRNAQDGISLIQTAEGALTEVHNMLTRMRELATQAANDTNAAARVQIGAEITELNAEIARINTDTRFAGNAVFSATAQALQVGSGATHSFTVTTGTIAAITVAVDSATNAQSAITTISGAIDTISGTRASLGAAQNRLESVVNGLAVTIENTIAAESRIRDVDMAAEMVNFTRFQIMNQAGTAMVGQANALPQSILSLLR